MNILHIIRDLDSRTGGPVSALVGMANAQVAVSHRVVVAATNILKYAAPFDARVSVVGTTGAMRAGYWAPGLKKILQSCIIECDIVHIHMIWHYPALVASTIAAHYGRPYILRPCGMLDQWSMSQKRFKKQLYLSLSGRKLIGRASLIHFTSEQEERSSKAYAGDRPSVVIPLGVANEFLHGQSVGDEFRKHWKISRDERVLLFIGRLHSKKRPELVLAAFKLVKKDFPDSRLVFVGTGDVGYIRSLMDLAIQERIGSDVIFTGFLKGTARKGAFCAADAFILPSLQENFSNAMFEALGVGCPVVVTDNLDLAQVVRDEDVGLVTPADVTAIAAAVAKIFEDELLRSRMSAKARSLVRTRYSWPAIIPSLDRAYGNVIARAH